MTELTGSVARTYNLTEVFSGSSMGVLKPHDKVKFSVNPSGVFMFVAKVASRTWRPFGAETYQFEHL